MELHTSCFKEVWLISFEDIQFIVWSLFFSFIIVFLLLRASDVMSGHDSVQLYLVNTFVGRFVQVVGGG